MSLPQIAEIKNNWLYQQVDVQFPTKESLIGLEVYKKAVESRQYKRIEHNTGEQASFAQDDIFLVDFHRLTVMFSLLQSTQWHDSSDQDMIVEFLTQIIYSEPCALYLGFKSGEPVAAAIISQHEGSVLVSDVVVKSGDESETAAFVSAVLTKYDHTTQAEALYLEF
ncbi:flavodoxin [Vibrio sp. RE86]|uniref:flavodoxin n=1 Tax=Vibrio sp. RE86 TaxID=2607605 RepID=UPI0014939372|nr:flavodoxin [Vibrio sp. RE86]NOH81498.1 flavodoxin [Vibrio sp. RE86]